MAYTWAVVVAGISFLVYFTQLPLVLFPILLFGAFLASGGKSFPRVFFRTVFRDLRYVYRVSAISSWIKKHAKNNHTVVDIFRQTVSKHPQKIAFIFEKKQWTFQDVEDYSNRISNYFKSQGYQKGDTVALFLESCPEFVCIWLGLSKLGVISALINTNLRRDSLCHCISAADARAIIFGSDLSDAVKDVHHGQMLENIQLYYFGSSPCSVDTALSLFEELQRSPLKSPATDYTKSCNDVLMYIYTSGTTGYPKPVIVTNMRYLSFSLISRVLYCVTSEDIIYCTLPLYHTVGGALGVAACLCCGNTVVLRRKFSASRFWDDCVQTKATVIQYIGELCRYLLTQPHRPSDKQHSVRLAFGNGLRPQIWKEFQSRFGIEQIGEYYGSTEGYVGLANIDNKPGACGFVSVIAPGFLPVKFIKVDPVTGELLRGEDGLAISVSLGEPGLAVGKIAKGRPIRGYVNQDETLKKIGHDICKKGDSYFLSGDLLVTDEYGYVYFHDRIGDTFRWHGENVSTAEVEATMSKILGLRDVVVYGVKVPGTEGRAGMAAVVDPDNTGIDLSALVQGLNEQLPHYAHPIFLRIVASVAVTGTFKLLKNKLRQEGFDVGAIQDKLLYYDAKVGQYLVLDEDKHAKITCGEIRM